MRLGVWLTRHLADKRAHCCTLRRRGGDLLGCRLSLPPGVPAVGGRSRSVREPHATSVPRSRYLRKWPGGTGVRPRVRGDGTVVWHMPIRVRHARTACLCGPITTSSGWIAAAAQKLWSPGSSKSRPSPMLGAASRGPRALTRLLSLLRGRVGDHALPLLQAPRQPCRRQSYDR